MTRYGLEMAENETVTTITESRKIKTLPFRPSEAQLFKGKAQEDWLEGIDREFRYFKISNPQDKRDAIIIYGGQGILWLEKSLPDPVDSELRNSEKKLNDYVISKRNKNYSRYTFLKLRPNIGETTVAYATRQRKKAHNCDFGNNNDERILKHLTKTNENRTLIQICISKTWTLQEFLTEAGKREEISLEMKIGPDEQDIAKVVEPRHRTNRLQRYSGNTNKRAQGHICANCVFEVPPEGRTCPAYGKKCNNCLKYNHFVAVCISYWSRDVLGNRQSGGSYRKLQH